MSHGGDQASGGLRRIFFRVGPATLLVQLMSFASSVALATLLGPSTQTDAYYLALSVPALAYAVLIAAVRLGGIPALTKIAHSGSPVDFKRTCRELLTATGVAAGVMSIVLTTVMIVLLPAVVGGSARLHSLTREFIVELSPYAVTGALIGVLGAVLAVRGRFAITMLVMICEPALKTLLVLTFHRQLGAQALVIGSVVGNLTAVVVLWLVLWHDGLALLPAPFLQSTVLRSVLMLTVPLMVSQSVIQFNPVIDRAFASSLSSGSVTEFELGVRVFSAPAALIAATITAPLAATWAARFERNGWEAVTASLTRVIVVLTTLIPPLVAVGIVLRKQVIEFAYASHAYSPAAIDRTASVLAMLLLGFLPQLLITAAATLFIVRRETVFPMKVGIANCILNGVLDWALRGPLGVAGIALSTSITLTILCGVYWWGANRRWGLTSAVAVAWKPTALSFASAAAIGCASFLAVTLTGPYESRPMELGAIVCIGGIGLLVHWGVVAIGEVYGGGTDVVAIPGVKFLRLMLRGSVDGPATVSPGLVKSGKKRVWSALRG